jgi:hypothetical protein
MMRLGGEGDAGGQRLLSLVMNIMSVKHLTSSMLTDRELHSLSADKRLPRLSRCQGNSRPTLQLLPLPIANEPTGTIT